MLVRIGPGQEGILLCLVKAALGHPDREVIVPLVGHLDGSRRCGWRRGGGEKVPNGRFRESEDRLGLSGCSSSRARQVKTLDRL